MLHDRHFLVTAAHCLHGFELDPNYMDMAVYELDPETTNALKEKYQFLEWSRVNTTHSSLKIEPYMVFGYPESKTRKHFPTKLIIPEPFVARSIGMPGEYYAEQKIDFRKTLAIYIDQSQLASAAIDKCKD